MSDLNDIDNKFDDKATDLRELIKKSAIEFKRNWVSFAKVLSEVYKEKLYQNWGYSSIYEYAKKELFIKKETVFKLLSSYDFLIEENIVFEDNNIPPLDSIIGLAKLKNTVNKNLENNNLSSDKVKDIIQNYSNIKNDVLQKGLSLNTIIKKGKSIINDNILDDNENTNEKLSSINLSREEKKRALFHLRRLSYIIIRDDTPTNIINSIKDIEEFLS
ncbi:MAG: hypothetical protein N3A58_08680 [Spirochaetes bacterium]|nr:hypothetical protein [Spirochaetota bacterium]